MSAVSRSSKSPVAGAGPQCATAAAVAGCESVRLFMERARAAWPGFVLDEENAASIAGITREAGRPAPRGRAGGGASEAPAAGGAARTAGTRVAVLVGGAVTCRNVSRPCAARSPGATGCSVRAPGACWRSARCSAAASAWKAPSRLRGGDRPGRRGPGRTRGARRPEPAAPDRGVAGPGGPRFGMLFMVREYAAERLAEMPERARVEEGHAATFLALAEEAGRGLRGHGELEWLDRLEAEHQNIRAAIDWYTRHEPGERCGWPWRCPASGASRSLHGRTRTAEGAARRVRGRNLHAGEGAERRGVAGDRPGGLPGARDCWARASG